MMLKTFSTDSQCCSYFSFHDCSNKHVALLPAFLVTITDCHFNSNHNVFLILTKISMYLSPNKNLNSNIINLCCSLKSSNLLLQPSLLLVGTLVLLRMSRKTSVVLKFQISLCCFVKASGPVQ